MSRLFPTCIWCTLALVFSASVADARWFSVRSGRTRLREIARTLAAGPDGEVTRVFRLTRTPEAPAPPAEEARRKHDPVLTAEAAKSAVFAGPAEYTAMVEVGLDAANAKADAMLPSVEEMLSAPTGGEGTEEGGEAPTGGDPDGLAPAPAGSNDLPVDDGGLLAPAPEVLLP